MGVDDATAVLAAVLSRPNCRKPLEPHAARVPSAHNARLWLEPASTATTLYEASPYRHSIRAGMAVQRNVTADVAGAKGSGLLAVWKRDPFWPEPPQADWVIEELTELLPRLAAMR